MFNSHDTIMLVLHFFKAGRPYHNTNGYQHNHFWMHGVAGPMSMQECLRLSANMGGNILKMEYPGIDNLNDLTSILEPYTEEGGVTFADLIENAKPEGVSPAKAQTVDELVGGSNGMDDNQLAKAMEDEFQDKPELNADAMLGMNYEQFMNLNNSGVRQIAESLDIVIPSHSERLSLLATAKMEETFNYTKYIGNSRSQINVLKAFVLMRVGELLHAEPVA